MTEDILRDELDTLCQDIEGHRAGALTNDGLWHYHEKARATLRAAQQEAEATMACHSWTTSTDLNKCDICGDGPWGRHRFEKRS